MDYGDYNWGLYKDYYMDPFPHSLLSTRQPFNLNFQQAFEGFTCRAQEPQRWDEGRLDEGSD